MSSDLEAKVILKEIRDRVATGTDGSMYGDRTKALKDINALLDSPSSEGTKLLLLPTANLQELSIENGWGDEFNNFANNLEILLGIS
jgi:hypothetical protein